MAILTVYTKLLDKTLSGPRIIDMGSTRTCQLYVIPRTHLSQLGKEAMLRRYCFYILLGRTPSGARKAYIGQSNDFLHRVKDHQSKKEFWDTALVFVSKANEIYASEVFFLEYLGISKALEAGVYSLEENKQMPQKPSIAPDKENDMELFFDEIQFLTLFYGCTIFEKEAPAPASVAEPCHDFHLRMNKKGVDATLCYFPDSGRYVIRAGSKVAAVDSPSMNKAIARLRSERLTAKGNAIRKGDTYELLQDVEIAPASPSAAASFCTATSIQGTTAWVDDDSRSFVDVFPEY